jgi:hypothetical protein
MEIWRKCSSCKKEIFCRSFYFVCSVSTCQQKKTDYAFCSVECWDAHIPVERHRGEGFSAIERRAPDRANTESPLTQKRRVISDIHATKSSGLMGSIETDVLVVASKVKKYISDRSQMNTSASTMDALTDRVKRLCDRAIQNAREDGRKTVMDRDIP